jgi:hypothetical protein
MADFTVPTITESIGSHSYEWDTGLHIDVIRVKDNDAELWIYQQNGDGKHHFLDAMKFDLMGARSEDSFTKRLTPRDSDTDWSAVFRYVIANSLDIYRRGEPLRELGHKPKTMALDYQMWPLVEKAKITTLYGPGGTCKSYLAIGIAIDIQFNYGVFSQLHPSWTPVCGNVLYLDWEADLETHERRVWAIKKGMGITDEESFDYLFCDQPLINIVDQIQRHVSKRNIVFIVVDSQMAASGSGNDAGVVATAFNNALRSFRTASLVIDHVNKTDWRGGTESNSNGPIGSVVKYNRARSVFEVQKSQEAGDAYVDLSIIHKKHNDGALLKPMGIRINFINKGSMLDMVKFVPCNLADNDDLVKTMVIKDRLKAALIYGPRTTEELAEITGIKPGSAKTKLNLYKNTFTKNGDFWALTGKDEHE